MCVVGRGNDETSEYIKQTRKLAQTQTQTNPFNALSTKQTHLNWQHQRDEDDENTKKNIKFEFQCFDFVLLSHRIALIRIQIIRLKIELMLCARIHCVSLTFCVWKAACKRANEIIAPLCYILRSRSRQRLWIWTHRTEQNKTKDGRAHGFRHDRCDVLLLVFPRFVMRLFTTLQYFSHIWIAQRRFASFPKSIFGKTPSKGSATIQFLYNARVPEVLESFWQFCVSFPLKMANMRISLRTEYDFILLWCTSTLHLFCRNQKRRKEKNRKQRKCGDSMCIYKLLKKNTRKKMMEITVQTITSRNF